MTAQTENQKFIIRETNSNHVYTGRAGAGFLDVNGAFEYNSMAAAKKRADFLQSFSVMNGKNYVVEAV